MWFDCSFISTTLNDHDGRWTAGTADRYRANYRHKQTKLLPQSRCLIWSHFRAATINRLIIPKGNYTLLLFFFKQKYQQFAGSSFLNLQINIFSLSYKIVNIIYLGFGQLFGQTENVTLCSVFSLIINIEHYQQIKSTTFYDRGGLTWW